MIIGISGKIRSGKDTIGQIIQYLISTKNYKEKVALFKNCLEAKSSFISNNSGWEVKKFADTLKDIICLLINCTREQLEDQEFKNKELGEEWNVEYTGEKLTPRKLLQLIGTECGREIIHPNIWVNSLFSNYKLEEIIEPISQKNKDKYEVGFAPTKQCSMKYPNWIITDVRFPNEAKAIKDRGGILIRVNRENNNTGNHLSETALDNAEFDYIIDNNSSIEDLTNNVKQILIKEKII